MDWNLKETNQQKHQFRSYYCADCRQRKPCRLLTEWDREWENYCCWCYFQSEQERAARYNSYEETLAQKQIEQEKRLRQLQLLKSYQGCKECGSLEVDAWNLLEETRLVCQPCRAKREGWTSSPISFWEKSQWYRKRWGINLSEWLENFLRLPVNKRCVNEWKLHKGHLKECECLEVEARERYLLINDNLTILSERLRDCSCESSAKIRTDSDDWVWCERCERSIKAASKKRVIKNRNDPRFWGLSVVEKVLCLECIGKEYYEEMEERQRKKWREYVRRGYG